MDIIGLYEKLYNFYGWNYWDLMCLPIPVLVTTLEALQKRLEEENKAREKALKDSKNKGNKHGN